MSRSRRKTPISGITTAASEKEDKRLANRRWRRRNKQLVQCGHYEPLQHLREITNVWLMDKDGKFRFDPERFPELMRK